jgi:hypothetical protein
MYRTPSSIIAKALLIFSQGAIIKRFEAPTTYNILANELSASILDLKPFDFNWVHISTDLTEFL